MPRFARGKEAKRIVANKSRDDALRYFKRIDPHFYAATKAHHTSLPVKISGKRTRGELFESLVAIVTSQQLATGAADAIFTRVRKVCDEQLTPESILKTHPGVFRKAGLSGAKIKTIKEIAKAVKNGSLDLLSLKKINEEDAAEKLMSIQGLGPWSVEMFMINSLGRADVFSAGDLGLIRSIEAIFNFPKNTPRASLLTITEKWSPYRTYASLLLWRARDMKEDSSKR